MDVRELKEYVEAILDEQRRGMIVAEQEREKAAKALREELTRQIEQGDQSLRDHVRTQIDQIKLLATSLDDQSRLRIDAVAGDVVRVEKAAEQHVEQLRREREMVTSAQMEAIAKAETASEKRFESVNEFRAQLADQTSTFLPREVAESQFAELRKQMNQNTDRLNRMSGSDEGAAGVKTALTSTAMAWIAGLGLLVAVLSIAVVVILANHAGP